MAKSRTSWEKGRSGNPRGRPHIVFELREAAREHGPRCIEILAEMADSAANEAVRVAAARELLDRGFGKATTILAGDEDRPPAVISFRWAAATPPDAAAVVTDATIADTRSETPRPLALAWKSNC